MQKTQISEFMKLLHKFKRLNFASIMPSDITPMEFQLLSSVQEVSTQQGNTDVRVSAACRNMHASNPAVSRMLRILENKELIYREVDTNDRRNTYIRLTEKGKERCEEIQEGVNSFTEAIFAQLGEENIEKIIELMNRMYDLAEKEITFRRNTEKYKTKGSGVVGEDI